MFCPTSFILRGVPAHIRSNNGPEFVAQAVQDWIAVVGNKTAYIEARGRTATSRASTPAFAMSRSTARSSTFCARPRSSSRAGAPRLNGIQATSNISAAAYALRRWHPAGDTARLLQVLHERKCQHRDGGRTRPRSERGLPERGAVVGTGTTFLLPVPLRVSADARRRDQLSKERLIVRQSSSMISST